MDFLDERVITSAGYIVALVPCIAARIIVRISVADWMRIAVAGLIATVVVVRHGGFGSKSKMKVEMGEILPFTGTILVRREREMKKRRV